VIATAGAAEKQARVRELGADEVLDYRDPEIVSRAQAVAAHGVNVYWETQREPDFDRAVAILGEGGRMVLMAGRDARPAFPVGPFYVKGCTLIGFVMFKASWQDQAAAAADISRWLAAGRLRVPIDRVLPLADTAAAHALQEAATVGRSGGLAGKIVIEP
jgi:NADPH2:quinone reductase